MTKYIVIVTYLFLITVIITGCKRDKISSASSFDCKVIQVEKGYGYVITHKRDTVIKQPFIPAVKGQVAFSSTADAQKIGKYVANKLQRGLPPIVERAELEKLGIKMPNSNH